MIGSLYKIISKILAARLQVVVSETQTGFMKGRSILDGVLTGNEVVKWLKKKKKPGALLNLDFRKAYDTVRWSFLENMLKQIGLGPNMIRWRSWCVSSVSISILINGTPTKPFNMQRVLGKEIPPYHSSLI